MIEIKSELNLNIRNNENFITVKVLSAVKNSIEFNEVKVHTGLKIKGKGFVPYFEAISRIKNADLLNLSYEIKDNGILYLIIRSKRHLNLKLGDAIVRMYLLSTIDLSDVQIDYK